MRFRKTLPEQTRARVKESLEMLASAGKGRWGLIKTYRSAKSAASTATWMRGRYKGFEFSAQGAEVWARSKGTKKKGA